MKQKAKNTKAKKLKKMRGELTLKVLSAVGETAISLGDTLLAIMSSGYGASYNKIEYEISRISNDRIKNNAEYKKYAEMKRKSEKFISYLRNDGLVEIKKESSQKMISLTPKGRKRLKELAKKEKNAFPSSQSYESSQKNANPIIIIFDIPEKEREKRAWLRESIKNLGFKMLQRSVWLGNFKIPQLFLEDIKNLHITAYVEIFEITKKGSMEKVF